MGRKDLPVSQLESSVASWRPQGVGMDTHLRLVFYPQSATCHVFSSGPSESRSSNCSLTKSRPLSTHHQPHLPSHLSRLILLIFLPSSCPCLHLQNPFLASPSDNPITRWLRQSVVPPVKQSRTIKKIFPQFLTCGNVAEGYGRNRGRNLQRRQRWQLRLHPFLSPILFTRGKEWQFR